MAACSASVTTWPAGCASTPLEDTKAPVESRSTAGSGAAGAGAARNMVTASPATGAGVGLGMGPSTPG